MPFQPAAEPIADRELSITRLINAPREKIFRAWTEPALITQWFTPAPWKTIRAETDLRPGGSSVIVMQSPEGQEFPNRGVYLDVVKNERLVFTDAFVKAWEPSNKPFMVGTITLENQHGQTLYTARVQHWSIADRVTHEQMGFHPGWNKATDQLAELVARI